MPKVSRRGSLAGLAAVIGLLLGVASPSLAQEAKTARLGHSFADSHPRSAAMKYFAEKVAEATGGKVKVDVFGNATLGSEEKMLIATQAGTIDFYMGALSPIATRKKEIQIFDFPFLFASDAEAAAVLDGPAGRKILDGLADMTLQGLVWSGSSCRLRSANPRASGCCRRARRPARGSSSRPCPSTPPRA